MMTRDVIIKKIFAPALTLLTVFTLTACGSDDDDNSGGSSPKVRNANANVLTRPEYGRLEFPKLKGGTNVVLVHTDPSYGVNYSVEWDVSKKSQRWSCFQWHNANSGGGTSRYYGDPQYPADPDLPSASGWTPSNDPYYRSGYDHGHIVASADRLCSSNMNYQTFFLTNMQPQKNKFNAGIWSKMENHIRTWNRSSFRDTLFVCKGGTIDNANQILTTTGKGLLVPRFFYMALLCKKNSDKTNGGYKAIAFWVEHIDEDRSTDNLKNYLISIDELEQLTGIDFFCNLPDDIENVIEAQLAPLAWGMK